MYGGIRDGLLNMTCDVYVQQKVQDAEHGGIKRTWVFDKKITCHIDIISSAGARTPDNNKNFGFIYIEEEKMRLKTKDPLSKRHRISNLKNRAGEVVFIENDKIDTPPTIFEIESYHPRLDPFGNILFYECNLRRVGVQDDTY
jgi:hypothetical protein